MSKNPSLEIAQWLLELSKVSHGASKPSGEQLKSYAKLLAADFGPGVFTQKALNRVATDLDFFPSFSVLKAALVQLEKERQTTLLSGPIPATLRDRIEQLNDNDAYRRRVTSELAQCREGWGDPAKVRASLRELEDANTPMRMTLGKMLAAIVLKHAPQNLEILPPEFAADAMERRDLSRRREREREERMAEAAFQ